MAATASSTAKPAVPTDHPPPLPPTFTYNGATTAASTALNDSSSIGSSVSNPFAAASAQRQHNSPSASYKARPGFPAPGIYPPHPVPSQNPQMMEYFQRIAAAAASEGSSPNLGPKSGLFPSLPPSLSGPGGLSMPPRLPGPPPMLGRPIPGIGTGKQTPLAPPPPLIPATMQQKKASQLSENSEDGPIIP